MSLVSSVETWLEDLGGEKPGAAVQVAVLRRLAGLLDENPFSEPEIYRELRFAVKAVQEAYADDSGVDRELDELLARLGRTDLRDGADVG